MVQVYFHSQRHITCNLRKYFYPSNHTRPTNHWSVDEIRPNEMQSDKDWALWSAVNQSPIHPLSRKQSQKSSKRNLVFAVPRPWPESRRNVEEVNCILLNVRITSSNTWTWCYSKHIYCTYYPQINLCDTSMLTQHEEAFRFAVEVRQQNCTLKNNGV